MDRAYKLFIEKPSLYWRTKDKMQMSDDFKELIEFLLAYEPTARPVMADIIGHSWMRAETVSEEDFKTQVDAYIDQVKAK